MLAAGLVALMVVTGWWLTVATDRASYPLTDGIHRVEVVMHAGDLEVVTSNGRAGVESAIRAPRWRALTPPEPEVVDGVVRITDPCSRSRWCGAHHRVVVPPGTDLIVRSVAANVAATGVGNVAIDASAGDVVLRRIVGDEVRVDTRAGAVRVSADRAARSLQVRATAGDVVIDVPAGSYRVDASTRFGDRLVSVDQSSEASHHIEARTTAGDVIVRSRR